MENKLIEKPTRRGAGKTTLTEYSNITPEGSEGMEMLEALGKGTTRDDRFKIIHAIGDEKVLTLAYELIKSKQGNMTKGTDKSTLDGMSIKWIRAVAKEIKGGKFRFTPSHRTYIPKPNNPKERRPLSIANPKEKVVQKAIELCLNAIYEPTFTEHSHGSRPQKGNHTALKYVKQKFKSAQ